MSTSQAQQPAIRKRKRETTTPTTSKNAHKLARALDSKKEILVRADEETRFSHALTNFVEQQCVKGADLTVSDKQLFRRFRAFWMQAPERFDHPALLGQFRVELTQRGFRSDSAGKHPRWLGLSLRRQEKKGLQKKERR